MTTVFSAKKRLINFLFPALLIGLQLGLFSAWRVYTGNQAEFDHGFLDMSPYLVLVALLVFVLFWLAPVLLPQTKHRRAVAFLTTLGILMWLQSSIFVWNYGVFDGGSVDWSKNLLLGFMELALWLVALAAAVRWPQRVFKQSRFFCLGFILIQLSFLTITSMRADEGFWHREGSFSDLAPEQIYEYSSNRNVVHILLDAFQTDVFKELVTEENLQDKLDGFVLYEENLGVAAYTSFSIPAIFSGDIFDGTESPNNYYNRSINELGFQNVLHDQGYRINVLPRLPMDKGKFHNHFRIPTTYGGNSGFRLRQAACYLFDIGLFRQAPHFLKKWVYNDQRWRISSLISTPPAMRSIHQRAFFQEYIAQISPVLDEPVYSFVHIMSPHPPYAILADGSAASGPVELTRENYKHEARYTLRVFMELLTRLQELELYDETLIILQGDHGIDFPPQVNGLDISLPVGRAPTLLAIKVPAANGKLKISPALSAVSDLPATVMDILNIDHHYPGESLLSLADNTQRIRGFFQHLSRDRERPIIKRYEVDGSLFDPKNWTALDDVEVARESVHYSWATVLEFGMEGNADPFKGIGWSAPTSLYQWSDGHQAKLHFQVDPSQEDLEMAFLVRPFVAPGIIEAQHVPVWINGKKIEQLLIESAQCYYLRIPAQFTAGGNLDITFDLPDAAIPDELGVNGDKRMLGIAVAVVCIYPKSMGQLKLD